MMDVLQVIMDLTECIAIFLEILFNRVFAEKKEER